VGATSLTPPPISCDHAATTVVPPTYPPIARTNLIEGTVFLQVDVDPDTGSPKDVRAFEGHPMLRESALEAVRKWRFNTKCSLTRTVDIKYRISKNDQRDPAGTYVHDDEVEIVAYQPVVDTTSTDINKKTNKKRKSKATGTSK